MIKQQPNSAMEKVQLSSKHYFVTTINQTSMFCCNQTKENCKETRKKFFPIKINQTVEQDRKNIHPPLYFSSKKKTQKRQNKTRHNSPEDNLDI